MSLLTSLAGYALVVVLAMALHVLIVLLPALRIGARLGVVAFFRATSDALVNLRFGLARACTLRLIDARTRDALVELARGWFYRERSWARLFAEARGLDVTALAAWPKPDRKADDARLVLRRIDHRRPPQLRVPRTWALRQLSRR